MQLLLRIHDQSNTRREKANMEVTKQKTVTGECWLTIRSTGVDYCIVHVLDKNGNDIRWEKADKTLNISISQRREVKEPADKQGTGCIDDEAEVGTGRIAK